MKNSNKYVMAFKAAFPATLPFRRILFLGIAYGILMNLFGFGAGYAILMDMPFFS